MKKLILTILLSAAVLYGASAGLKDMAEANAGVELLRTMQTLLPGSTTYTPEVCDPGDGVIRAIYRGETGWVVETGTRGYAGPIVMLVGVSDEGRVTGLRIRDLSETPGLGAKALTDADFLAQFLNTGGDAQVGENVEAITGATVTSRAIARSVNAAVAGVTGADADTGATG